MLSVLYNHVLVKALDLFSWDNESFLVRPVDSTQLMDIYLIKLKPVPFKVFHLNQVLEINILEIPSSVSILQI